MNNENNITAVDEIVFRLNSAYGFPRKPGPGYAWRTKKVLPERFDNTCFLLCRERIDGERFAMVVFPDGTTTWAKASWIKARS